MGPNPDPDPTDTVQPAIGIAGDGKLQAHLNFLRNKHNVPALSVLMVHNGTIVEKEAVGVRTMGHSESVTMQDRWYIGSITKSMTATLAAHLVEQGVISWDTTIETVFPEFVGSILSEYHTVSLEELLAHTAGIQTAGDDVWALFLNNPAPLSQQRLELTFGALTFPQEAPRGTHHYSNINYVIVGTMLEKITATPWEVLMQNHLFTPLNMNATGFLDTNAPGSHIQPWGHVQAGNIWTPVDPAVADVAYVPVAGPAGSTLHTTLDDIAHYMSAHLNGAKGMSGLLTPTSYTKLHTPFPTTQAALGWDAVNGTLSHGGSNGSWFAFLILNPAIDTALFGVINADGDTARTALIEAMDVLSKRSLAAYGSN